MTDKKPKQDSLSRVKFRPPENDDLGDDNKDNDDEDDYVNNTETTKIATEIETEIERDDWIPDGGWGWGIVAGAVIIHVYIGKMVYLMF